MREREDLTAFNGNLKQHCPITVNGLIIIIIIENKTLF